MVRHKLVQQYLIPEISYLMEIFVVHMVLTRVLKYQIFSEILWALIGKL